MPKCHYEVLGIPLDAEDAQIKKSYRKLALKYHPDKNQDNLDFAVENFRLVQAAYDCLSDSHERAWYDDHREAILKGYTIGSGEEYNTDEENAELYKYMTSFCYNGFNDDPKGFYKVYLNLFLRIEQSEPSDSNCLPSFGTSKSDWDDVDTFYSFWQSFSTKCTYGYLDKYDTREAPDRRVRRLMEQENKKIKDRAKKQRNDIIRELVRFIKRRDPRVEERKLFVENKNKEKKQRQELKRIEMLDKKIEEAILYEEKIRNDSENIRNMELLADLEAAMELEEEMEIEYKSKKRGKKKNKRDSDDEFMNITRPEKSKKKKNKEKIVVSDNPEDVALCESENSEPDVFGQSNLTKKKRKNKKKKNTQISDIDQQIEMLEEVNLSSEFTQKTKKKKKKKR